MRRNRFSCQSCSLYKGSKQEITGCKEFQKYTLNNDCRNQRDQGRKKSRRRHFNLIVSKHKNISEIDNDEEEPITYMADGHEKDSQIQNIVFNKTRKLIPISIIRQITRVSKRLIIKDSDFKDMFHEKDTQNLSSTEFMMKYCR